MKERLRVGQHIKPEVYDYVDRYLELCLTRLIVGLVKAINEDESKRRIDNTHVDAAIAELYVTEIMERIENE
jgi:hypothetical protein